MLNVNVSSSFLARKEVEPKPLDSQNRRTHRRLYAFIVAALPIDLVSVLIFNYLDCTFSGSALLI